MKPVKVNWYGFKHAAVNKVLTGGLKFCNSFCVNGEYSPVAVYYAKNPDLSKGHKHYVLLQVDAGRTLVRGMTAEEIEPFRTATGAHCHKCGQVVFSVMRHDYRNCKCGATFIDGGKDYVRWGSEWGSDLVTVDLITNQVIDLKGK